MNKIVIAAASVAFLAAPPVFAQSGQSPQKQQQDVQYSGSSTPANEKLSDQDRSFLRKAAEGNVSEIKLGQLGVEKASNPAVKKYAQRILNDHKKAKQKLEDVAQQEHLTLPEHVSQDAAGTYDDLMQKTGKEFDKAYMSAMVDDHQSDIDTFKKQVDDGKNQQLKHYAQNTLGVLQQHLSEAKTIEDQIGG